MPAVTDPSRCAQFPKGWEDAPELNEPADLSHLSASDRAARAMAGAEVPREAFRGGIPFSQDDSSKLLCNSSFSPYQSTDGSKNEQVHPSKSIK
jgi:hypothetical protein